MNSQRFEAWLPRLESCWNLECRVNGFLAVRLIQRSAWLVTEPIWPTNWVYTIFLIKRHLNGFLCFFCIKVVGKVATNIYLTNQFLRLYLTYQVVLPTNQLERWTLVEFSAWSARSLSSFFWLQKQPSPGELLVLSKQRTGFGEDWSLEIGCQQ